MPNCSATTAAGKPCKNHTMPGFTLCKAHGGAALAIRRGAPLANSNAAKHGFCRPILREEEYADLLIYAEQLDLAGKLSEETPQKVMLPPSGKGTLCVNTASASLLAAAITC